LKQAKKSGLKLALHLAEVCKSYLSFIVFFLLYWRFFLNTCTASVWNNSQFGRKTKMKLLKSNVLSVLLYGSETWKMTEGDEKILDTFLHKCIRSILKIYWPEKITNTEARRKRAGLEKISTIVKKRRWQWIGHVLRMDNNRNTRTALDWAPEGKRKRGRPKETWRRTVEKERKQLGFNTWAEATRQVQDRSKWRGLVHGPILHEETGN
jgi:hypothetical protein